nr:hypothetical protein Ccrd_012105 [Ipomoea batatas]
MAGFPFSMADLAPSTSLGRTALSSSSKAAIFWKIDNLDGWSSPLTPIVRVLLATWLTVFFTAFFKFSSRDQTQGVNILVVLLGALDVIGDGIGQELKL